ncbi:uncharacterized protein LOC118200736 [Stegodyphus dumicola]|uniref:uncharacterized protein LOC118200736 n=1 Tax=Stegodyphus dumicola TaxID=202533 RepID=UPI0015B28922|nr:uncharacterized protein LOC118200736 [Stegodyphus dumicola]
MTYCCEAVITSPQSVVNKLEVMQNQALRLITGAMKSTYIVAILLLSGNKTFRDIMKMRALVLFEKLLRMEDSYRSDYVVKPKKLNTQNEFIQKDLDMKKDLGIPGNIQSVLTTRSPLEVINIEVSLDTVETIHRKRDVAPSVLKCLALETIAFRYPPIQWLPIFTDGSQFDCLFKVGAGVFSSLFSFYTSAGYIGTSFDGEVLAICIDLQQSLQVCKGSHFF